MPERFLVEAVNDALHVEMERDPTVLVMGEDVGRLGGVFRATAGLQDRFGEDRCIDTPLAEAGIVGTAVGLCMAGWRPVCEMQYDAFSYPGLDQLINHVGRYRWRTGGKMSFPLTIRMPYGGGVRAPELHDDSPETYYVHTPGVKVAIPATPADAKGLLSAAIRDPDPVVILEPKLHYRTSKEEVPDGEHVVPLGQARIAREGSDVTLVAYGAMVPLCEKTAEALAGRRVLRGPRPALAEASRRGCAARVRREDGPRGARPGSASRVRLRRGGGRRTRREGDLRPAWARAPGHGLRRALPVLADRGCLHAFGRADRRRGATRARRLVAVTVHEIPLERRTLHGHFSCDLEPVLTIDSGDSIVFSAPDAGWGVGPPTDTDGNRERFEPRDDDLDAGHPLVGPVEVRGARSGRDAGGADRRGASRDVGDHRCGRLAHSAERAARGRGRRHRRRLSGSSTLTPGSVATSAVGPSPSSVPRRDRHAARRARRPLDGSASSGGGNIDCKELVAGTTLFLPISVDGALLSAGDGHAAQGDGEVSQLAIEAPLERAQLTLVLRDDLALATPVAWTPDAWLTFGFDEDLDEAAAIAIDAMLELMGREHGLGRREALALASVVVDLRVTQMVNGVRGIHAVLSHDAIRG